MLRTPSLTKAILVLILAVSAFRAVGQSKSLELPSTERHSLGISAGTNALLGIDYARPLAGKFWMRASLSFMDFNVRKWETNFNYSDYYASIDLNVRNTALNLMADYAVGPKRTFRLVAGLGFFFMNQMSGAVKLRDAVVLNDIAFTPDELGYVYGGVKYRLKFNPYVGIGLGRIVHPNRRLTVSADLGTYYKGAPEIFVNGTALIRNNEHNAAVLTDNLSSYRWYPVINLRLGYSIDPIR